MSSSAALRGRLPGLVGEELLQVCQRLRLRGTFNGLLGDLLNFLVRGLELLGQLGILVAQIFGDLLQRLDARRRDVPLALELFAEQFLAALGVCFQPLGRFLDGPVDR